MKEEQRLIEEEEEAKRLELELENEAKGIIPPDTNDSKIDNDSSKSQETNESTNKTISTENNDVTMKDATKQDVTHQEPPTTEKKDALAGLSNGLGILSQAISEAGIEASDAGFTLDKGQ